MDRDEIFTATTAMRRGHADLLAGLDAAQLTVHSLCAGWDVLTCAAHTAVSASVSPAAFVLATLRYGGPHRATTELARRLAATGTDGVVETIRDTAERRVTPPIVREYGPFTDQVVHGLDIRRPLGISWQPEPEVVTAALGFLTSGRATGFVGRGWLAGLHVEADDMPFAAGDGAVLRGHGIDLAGALCGRRTILDDLHGDGVGALRARLR